MQIMQGFIDQYHSLELHPCGIWNLSLLRHMLNLGTDENQQPPKAIIIQWCFQWVCNRQVSTIKKRCLLLLAPLLVVTAERSTIKWAQGLNYSLTSVGCSLEVKIKTNAIRATFGSLYCFSLYCTFLCIEKGFQSPVQTIGSFSKAFNVITFLK